MRDLTKMMHPKSVAIIGASPKPDSVGNELVKRAVEARFNGQIFAINPKYTEIEGVPCYPSVANVPSPIDVAIIATPAPTVLDVIKECASVKISNVVIISSGFKETGSEGQALEQAIADFANANGINVIGPNCLGILNNAPDVRFDGCFAPIQAVSGNIGFATQSGALASGIINLLPTLKIGLAQMVSLGNQCQINALDIMEMWEQDDKIKQILMYIESIPDPVKFREVASRVSRKKPILIIKSGRSARGAKASVSHTGSLAGDDTTAMGLFASSGVIRELYLRDLFNTAQVFSKCELPKGDKLAIVTNAGGPGIMATDTANDYSIPLADLTDKTKEKLRAVLPPQASINNPVDVIASATAEQYEQATSILLDAKEVDILLVIYLYIAGKNDIKISKALEALKKKHPSKPIVSVFMTTPEFDSDVVKEIPDFDIPTFRFVVDAVHGIARLVERKNYLDKKPQPAPNLRVNRERASEILASARAQGIKQLTTMQSLQIFDAYGLPLPKFGIAQTLKDARDIASQISYPVVLKLSSKTVTHKSDIGGVITNIKSDEELAFWWNRLVDRLNKANLVETLDGIVVMQQVTGANRELVAGVVKKNGVHQMMFGLGGIFVEALKEVTFRPCPLTPQDAVDMLNATKAKNIMGFVRGGMATDPKIAEETLLRLSQLVTDFPEISEIDANPLMIDDKGRLLVVDARIVTE